MPVVQLDLDSSKSVRGLKDYDSAVDKSERNTDSKFKMMRDSVTSIAVTATATALAVGAAMATMGLASLDSASRMQEAQNKYNVVFEGLMGQADAWRANLQQNYNISGLAATKYLANTKAILDATGMQSSAAGKLSNDMVKLALDLASFSDVPIADAIEATTAALTGEMEMMKRFGIVIKAEEITQRAMIDNHLRSQAAVTEAMKAQAAYNIMLEKGGRALGDVARSADSYVTQLNILRATQENVAVSIGQQLIPFATEALRIFNEWNGTNDTATTVANAFNTALKYVVETVRFLYNGFQGLVLIGNSVVVAIAYLTDTVVGMAQMVLYPLEAIGEALGKFLEIDNPFAGITEGLKSAKEASEQFIASSKGVVNQQVEGIAKFNTAADSMVTVIEKQRVAKEKDVEVTKEETAALDAWTKGLDVVAPKVREVGNALDKTYTAAERATLAASRNSKMTTEQATAYQKLYSAAESARTAYEKQVATMGTSATPAAQKYAAALKQIADDADKALVEFEKMPRSLDSTTAAAGRASASIAGVGDSAVTASDKFAKFASQMTTFDSEFNSDDSGGDSGDGGAGKSGSFGSLSARGNLSEEQWKSLPESVRRGLAQKALTGNASDWDYFNNDSGGRFKPLPGGGAQGQINSRAQQAYDASQLGKGNTVTNYFTQSVSRSDIDNIMQDMQRNTARA